MLLNYLKIALRVIWKDRLFTVLNLLGLALGLTVSSLLLLYVKDEWSFDKYHQKAAHVYRVNLDVNYEGETEKWATAPNIVGPKAAEEVAGVDSYSRLLHHNFGATAFIRSGDRHFTEDRLFWADPGLFEIFDIPMAQGPPKALNGPNQVILSQSTANKYFPENDAIGKSIVIDNGVQLEITGIYQDFPSNTMLDANMIGNISSLGWATKRLYWSNASFETYLLLNEQTPPHKVQTGLDQLLAESVDKEKQWFSLQLQPLTAIHLHSTDITSSYTSKLGDPRQVQLLAALALVILLIACINYMNLATARAQQRYREVGINKALGATRWQVAKRFYSETSILVVLALLLSIGFIQLGLPFFNQLAGKQFQLGDLMEPANLLTLFGIATVVALLSGSYPALHLSGFNPKNLLQTSFRVDSGAGWLRKSLVVLQFTASLILIISTIVFYHQMSYIQKKTLGYNPEQVVAITTVAAENAQQIESLINQYKSVPEVAEAGFSQTFPGRDGSGYSITRPPEHVRQLLIQANRVSPEIIDILDLQLLAGKTLPNYEKSEEDTTVQVIVNRSVADFLGFAPEEAIGQPAYNFMGLDRAKIVGVVEDFHFESLHKPIGGYIFHNAPSTNKRFALVKLNTSNLAETMQRLERDFHRHIPQSAFDFTFLDSHLDALYRSERRTASVFSSFSILAIFLACLGLFGLSAYTAERRTKEIGVRKVLGASAANILGLLSKDFLRLVLISIVLAIPVTWFGMQRWLQHFAYRVDIEWWTFAIGGLGILLIAFATISFQSLRSALANPVDSLRHD